MKDRLTALATATIITLTLPTPLVAIAESAMNKFRSWVVDQQGTSWSGASELWTNPTGDDGEVSDATMRIGANNIGYTWVYKNVQQDGELRWNGDALRWEDSWHQPEGVALTIVPGHGSLLAAEYSYATGSGPDWHWRIKLAQRPDGTLVLQMTNIAPWGEEARAVRTIVRRTE